MSDLALVLRHRLARSGEPLQPRYDKQRQLSVEPSGTPTVHTPGSSDLVKTGARDQLTPED